MSSEYYNTKVISKHIKLVLVLKCKLGLLDYTYLVIKEAAQKLYKNRIE